MSEDEEHDEYKECNRGEHNWKHLKNEGIKECKICGMVRDVEDPRLEEDEEKEERTHYRTGPSFGSIIGPLVMISIMIAILPMVMSVFNEINEQFGENLDGQGYEEHQGTIISVRDMGGLFGSTYEATIQNDDGGTSTISSSSRLRVGDTVTLYFQYERGIKELKSWNLND